jgi:hypothetical protein
MSKELSDSIMITFLLFTMVFDAVLFVPVFFTKPELGKNKFPHFDSVYFWVGLLVLNGLAAYLTRPGFLR